MSFLIFFLHFISIGYASECLSLNSSGSKCSFCTFDYYYDNFYFDLGTDFYFDISQCNQRIQSVNEREVYINSYLNIDFEDGSVNYPYKNIINAFTKESQIMKKYNLSNITFYLIGEQSILPSMLINYEKIGKIQFFRNINAEIEITPLYCSKKNVNGCLSNNEDKVTIYLKTDSFSIFIALSLKLNNLLIDGSDMNLPLFSPCINKSLICCQDCKWNKEANVVLSNDKNTALFILELIFDHPDNKIPQLIIYNFSVLNFYSYNAIDKVSGLILFSDGSPGRVLITNFLLSGFFLIEGLVSNSAREKSKIFYKITVNSSSFVNYGEGLINLKSEIILEQCTFQFYNKFRINVDANYNSVLRLFSNNFDISLKKINFANNVNCSSLIFFKNIQSVLKGLAFSGNEADSLFKFQNSQINISDCLFIHNNTLNTLIKLEFSTLFFKNNYVKLIELPKSYLISMISSILFIKNSIFEKLSSKTTYYLIQSVTTFYININSQMSNPDYSEPSFASDIIEIYASKFLGLEVCLLKNSISIIQFIIENSLIQNCLIKDSVFIYLHTERFSIFNNITVLDFYSSTLFMKLSYTRILSILNSKIKNSVFGSFVDAYSISCIDPNSDHRKCNFSIINSSFMNISLISINGASTYLVFINYYTLFRGFYFLQLEKNIFEDILTNGTLDDCLFYYASAHIKIVDSNFRDIGGLILFKMYCRIDGSNVTISNSSFQVLKYKLYSFFYVSITYNVGILKIVNCEFSSQKTIIASYAIEILQVQKLIMLNTTIKNIKSSTGGSLRIFVNSLLESYIENCIFENNSGFGSNGADLTLKIAENNEGLDFESLLRNNMSFFGLRNSFFLNSSDSGSITLLDEAHFFIFNCTFQNISSSTTSMMNIGIDSMVVFSNLNVIDVVSGGFGGCFNIYRTSLILLNCKIYNVVSYKDGGVLFVKKNSNIVIKNCSFQRTKAEEGGALKIESSILNIQNTKFIEGEAKQGGILSLLKSELYGDNVQLNKGKYLNFIQ